MNEETVLDRYVNKIVDRVKGEVNGLVKKALDERFKDFKDEFTSNLDLSDFVDDDVEAMIEKEIEWQLEKLDVLSENAVKDHIDETVNDAIGELNTLDQHDVLDIIYNEVDPEKFCIVEELRGEISENVSRIEDLEEENKRLSDTLNTLLKHPEIKNMVCEVEEKDGS